MSCLGVETSSVFLNFVEKKSSQEYFNSSRDLTQIAFSYLDMPMTTNSLPLSKISGRLWRSVQVTGMPTNTSLPRSWNREYSKSLQACNYCFSFVKGRMSILPDHYCSRTKQIAFKRTLFWLVKELQCMS